ncbi:hypothetical protein [Absidia glauca]|uniref:Uncharacterized protein n=1 Tax=Absidia glauca TaxID=4829 RepID=A0A163JCS0_ABSGL|nr:hypothetical protein [Absidia glauca]
MYLEPDVLQSFEKAFLGFPELDPTISDFISQVEAKEDDVDAIMELVCEQKLKYLQHKTSDTYACICCVEHIIDSLDLWKDDSGSEATYYRRLATLFDHIFKHTDIKLVDGETGCNATKTTIAFNKVMFNTHDMVPHISPQNRPTFKMPTLESEGFD